MTHEPGDLEPRVGDTLEQLRLKHEAVEDALMDLQSILDDLEATHLFDNTKSVVILAAEHRRAEDYARTLAENRGRASDPRFSPYGKDCVIITSYDDMQKLRGIRLEGADIVLLSPPKEMLFILKDLQGYHRIDVDDLMEIAHEQQKYINPNGFMRDRFRGRDDHVDPWRSNYTAVVGARDEFGTPLTTHFDGLRSFY